MDMHNSPKRRWLSAVALLTAASVAFLGVSSAHASQPGEGTDWAPEIVGGHRVSTPGAMVESRDPNNGNLLQVWRANNNTIRVSVGHGQDIELAGATTYANPAMHLAVSDGQSSTFRVFHTGTNGFVFYTEVTVTAGSQTPQVRPGWSQIPNGVATPNFFSVSVVAAPNRSTFLTYRGSSSNEEWSIFLSGTSNSWNNPTLVLGARSDYPMSLETDLSSWNPGWRGTIMGTWLGTDGQVNVIRQTYGEGSWWGHEILAGVQGDGAPSVAITGNGRGQVAVRRAGDNRIALTRVDASGGWQGGWDLELNGFRARAFSLFAYQAAIYLLATGGTGEVDWKQTWQN
ncbi:hypothetical protein ACFYUY_38360 [Kitasatospora sp. NPDC004745]|uniref:hypothetical protein n=1 Tax=Kitasatospora sp. NPDC004745 TaxID=3364019 RepID=UPI0036754520